MEGGGDTVPPPRKRSRSPRERQRVYECSDDVNVVIYRQYSFPLCWLMSSVNLLSNALRIGVLTLDKKVWDFLLNWKRLGSVTPYYFRKCPQVFPEDDVANYLRGDGSGNLRSIDVVTVFFSDPGSNEYHGYESDESEYRNYYEECGVKQHHARPNIPLDDKDNPEYLSETMMTGTISYERFQFELPANHPFVLKYLRLHGQRWFYEHMVNIKPFAGNGGDAWSITRLLLDYKDYDVNEWWLKNTYIKVHNRYACDGKPPVWNWIGNITLHPDEENKTELYFAKMKHRDEELFVREILPMYRVDETIPYQLIGGFIDYAPRSEGSSEGHVICFIQSSKYGTLFLDSNSMNVETTAPTKYGGIAGCEFLFKYKGHTTSGSVVSSSMLQLNLLLM